ncbi:hypothetical protein PZN02_002580 [Sinorhizobium garamanticum]|uniref:Uncharacterized protein n=1 Tax=Sinorhizobium garamanticum TaxID=680247 RepID=A0ABY8DB85_9HYPH|nr:hypothetical protein [Sinorhizobium garamanticum]WEX86306.1 hypothetical protein PZN02_002580 [Sinorhizobium garamanticum]
MKNLIQLLVGSIFCAWRHQKHLTIWFIFWVRAYPRHVKVNLGRLLNIP